MCEKSLRLCERKLAVGPGRVSSKITGTGFKFRVRVLRCKATYQINPGGQSDRMRGILTGRGARNIVMMMVVLMMVMMMIMMMIVMNITGKVDGCFG